MSIVETKRTYNLMPILKEAIEISEFNFERTYKMGGGLRISENMVTFGFGRQCGHTTTIRELLLNSPKEFSNNTVVVTPSYQMGNSLYTRYGVENVISAQQPRGSRNSLVGKRGYGIIFDSCKQSDMEIFFKELIPYIRGSDDLKFVVNVAPVF